jgi:predicted ATP-grasp superfamily ATP-dependent carboligase
MEIKLKETPKNPVIIEGFPGFGLIGSIVTEFWSIASASALEGTGLRSCLQQSQYTSRNSFIL